MEASSVDAVPAVFSLHCFFLLLTVPFCCHYEGEQTFLRASTSTRILCGFFIVVLTAFKEEP